MMSALLTGLLTGFSLIVAIGVQNALVLRQGLRREHVGIVVLVCAVSDFLLIAAGTAGMGTIAASHPLALRALSYVGAAYLLWCAFHSFCSAAKTEALEAADAPISRGSILKTVLGVTYLNPHVYLDTVVMLGSIAASHGAAKWHFASGAMLASMLWFPLIGFGAKALSGPLGKPVVWKWLDVVIGLVMVWFAIQLIVNAT